MSTELRIGVHSDDNIWYECEDDSEEMGTGEATFLIALPDGTRLPITVSYEGDWEFRLVLPEGSHLVEATDELVTPDDEESEEDDEGYVDED